MIKLTRREIMKKITLVIFSMILLMLFVTGCEDDEITYPPKTNRLEVTLGLQGGYEKPILAKDNIQITESSENVFVFTAEDEANAVVLEEWKIGFKLDPVLLQDQEQVILISDDNIYNYIRFNTPGDYGINDYLIEEGDLNDDITKIVITKYIPGEEIQGEFYGNIHEVNTNSNDSLIFGFFHTFNFVDK
jgi:hypothetical protein